MNSVGIDRRSIAFREAIQPPFHQLKRRDQVVLYAVQLCAAMSTKMVPPRAARWAVWWTIVDGERTRNTAGAGTSRIVFGTAPTTISVNLNQFTDYTIPTGYRTTGVQVASNILQRILRGAGGGL